mgnify:CR=1 FL=1
MTGWHLVPVRQIPCSISNKTVGNGLVSAHAIRVSQSIAPTRPNLTNFWLGLPRIEAPAPSLRPVINFSVEPTHNAHGWPIGRKRYNDRSRVGPLGRNPVCSRTRDALDQTSGWYAFGASFLIPRCSLLATDRPEIVAATTLPGRDPTAPVDL